MGTAKEMQNYIDKKYVKVWKIKFGFTDSIIVYTPIYYNGFSKDEVIECLGIKEIET